MSKPVNEHKFVRVCVQPGMTVCVSSAQAWTDGIERD